MADVLVHDAQGNLVREPDQLELLQADAATHRQMLNTIASVPLSAIAPDPSLPGPAGYIPFTGAAEYLAGLAGHVGHGISRLANAGLEATGLKPFVPDAPQILTTAGEHAEATRGQIQQQIGNVTGLEPPDPNTVSGRMTDLFGSAIGSGIGIAPTAAIAPVLNALPRLARPVASFLAPTFGHTPQNIAIGSIAGPVQGGPEALTTMPDTQQPTSLSDAAFGTPSPVPDNATNAKATTGLAPTGTQEANAASTSLSDAAFGAPPAPPSSDGSLSSVAFGASPPGPTFTQQGSTEAPLWAVGLGLLGTLALVRAGRYTHTLGNAMDTAARDARYADPAYAAQAQAYNADVISRGPNSGTLLPPGGTPTPAPVPQGNTLHQGIIGAAQYGTNEVAKAQDAIRMSAADPAMGERLASMAGNIYDGGLQQNKTENFMATGHDPRTGITIPSVKGLLDSRAELTQPEADVLAQGIKARNEIQNRTNNERTWRDANPNADPSVPPPLQDIAHDFFGHSTDELRGFVTAMDANPKLAEIATRFKGATLGMVDIGEHPNYGFFSPDEANRLRTDRSDYSPEMDATGKPMHPYGARDTTMFSGQAQIVTDPIRDLEQHVQQLYPQFERNLFNQEMREHQLDVQRRVPGAAQSMVDVQAPTGTHASYYPQSGIPEVGGQARDPIMAVRTPTGVKYIRNDDPVTRGVMERHSLSAARVQLGAANTAKRVFQQFTTGLGSTLTGRIVPFRTAIATGLVAPVNAPRNIRAGMLDYALQKASPGGVANRPLQSVARGLDIPLNLPGVAASYAMGVGDRRIKNFANIFHPNADNAINRAMRAYAGDPVVDQMHQAAERHWQQSATRWAREDVGLAGVGSPIQLDAPGVVTGTNAATGQPEGIRSLGAGMSPKAYFAADWAGSKPFFINMRNALGEMMNHVSEAGNDYVARLNRDNPNVDPESLTYRIRGLYGNPSRRGGGAGAQKVAGLLPWANIGTQELASTVGAVGRDPFGTATTLATGLGGMALLTLLTHMRSQQHMDFLQNQISTQQREANIILALNSDPTKPTVIPLPRSLRMANAFMLDVMSKAINYIGARHDLDTFNGVWEGIKDFLGAHITTSDAMALRHAGVDMVDFANVPPYVGHFDYNSLIQNGLAGLPSMWHPVTSGPVDKPLPQQGDATPMDSKTGEVFRNILTNTIGAAAATVYNTVADVPRYMKQGHDFLDSVGMAGRDWIQGGHEANPSLTMLWDTPIRLSKMPPIAESVAPTLFALKQLPPIPQPAAMGFTGGPSWGRLPVPMTGGEQPVLPSDPLIRQMLLSAHGYSRQIDTAMVPINAIKTQMQAVEKQGMDPVKRREFLNQQTRNMADRYKLVQAYAGDMYNTLSRLAGRPITSLGQIDWQRGREQFQQ